MSSISKPNIFKKAIFIEIELLDTYKVLTPFKASILKNF